MEATVLHCCTFPATGIFTLGFLLPPGGLGDFRAFWNFSCSCTCLSDNRLVGGFSYCYLHSTTWATCLEWRLHCSWNSGGCFLFSATVPFLWVECTCSATAAAWVPAHLECCWLLFPGVLHCHLPVPVCWNTCTACLPPLTAVSPPGWVHLVLPVAFYTAFLDVYCSTWRCILNYRISTTTWVCIRSYCLLIGLLFCSPVLPAVLFHLHFRYTCLPPGIFCSTCLPGWSVSTCTCSVLFWVQITLQVPGGVEISIFCSLPVPTVSISHWSASRCILYWSFLPFPFLFCYSHSAAFLRWGYDGHHHSVLFLISTILENFVHLFVSLESPFLFSEFVLFLFYARSVRSFISALFYCSFIFSLPVFGSRLFPGVPGCRCSVHSDAMEFLLRSTAPAAFPGMPLPPAAHRFYRFIRANFTVPAGISFWKYRYRLPAALSVPAPFRFVSALGVRFLHRYLRHHTSGISYGCSCTDAFYYRILPMEFLLICSTISSDLQPPGHRIPTTVPTVLLNFVHHFLVLFTFWVLHFILIRLQ